MQLSFWLTHWGSVGGVRCFLLTRKVGGSWRGGATAVEALAEDARGRLTRMALTVSGSSRTMLLIALVYSCDTIRPLFLLRIWLVSEWELCPPSTSIDHPPRPALYMVWVVAPIAKLLIQNGAVRTDGTADQLLR